MAFGIQRQQASRAGECFVMPDAGEYVEHFSPLWQRVTDAIGRQQRQIQFSRNLHSRLIARFLFTAQMSLQFHINILAAKKFAQLPHAGDSMVDSSTCQGMRQRPFLAAGQADQPLRSLGDFGSGNITFALGRAQFHPGDEPAKILISLARGHQQRIAPALRGGDFRADMRANGTFFRGQIKTRRAIDSVAIEQRHGRHSVLRAHCGQFLGQTKRLRES